MVAVWNIGDEFEFTADVSPERQAELRKEMASVQAFFAERYGVEPPEFSVVEDPSLGPFAAAAAGRIMLSTAAATSGAIAGAFAHEYSHLLQQSRQSQRRGVFSPAWLKEGTPLARATCMCSRRGK